MWDLMSFPLRCMDKQTLGYIIHEARTLSRVRFPVSQFDVLAICVVLQPEFQTRFSIFCCLLICLPSCFLLLSLLHFDVQNVTGLGLLPDEPAWEWMVG